MLTPGTLIHQRYQVLQQIGIGGMGAVYKALDTRLQHVVAVKHMLVSPAPERIEAFRREAQLLARLRHPALPRVSDHFVEDYGHFLVMEYIDGQDLSALLHAGAGTFDVSQVLSWADLLLDALIYLHTQQPAVIHRDIKPQNLKLTPSGKIMLLDFGLAKSALNSLTPELSGASVYGFTLQYAPMEQIQGAGTDARSDLYSLAATLYHLLAGVPPPNAPTRTSARLAGLPDPLLPIIAYNPQVPEALDGALRRALAIRAERRYISAAELRVVLHQIYTLKAEPDTVVRTLAPPLHLPEAVPNLTSLQPSSQVAELTLGQPTYSSDIQRAQAPALLPASKLLATRAGVWRARLIYTLPLLFLLPLLGMLVVPSANWLRLIVASGLVYLGLIGLLVLYDGLRRRRYTGTLGSHSDSVLGVAFSPNGRLIASAANDASIAIWQPGTRSQHTSCTGHRAPVRQLCFTPDSQTLISASDDATVRLWQAHDGTLLRVLEGHSGRLCKIALALDGQLIASASEDGTVRVWRVRDGALLHTLSGHSSGVLGVAISPDGALLASSGEDRLVRLWRVHDGVLLQNLLGHADAVCDVAFSPDGHTLASCSLDTTVKLWRASDGQLLHTLRGHTLPIGGVVFHPNGALLASRSEDTTVRVWRVANGKHMYTLGGHERYISGIAFAHHGDILASVSWDGSVRLWRVRDGQLQARLTGHAARILHLAVHPDGHALATGGLDRSVRVWQV